MHINTAGRFIVDSDCPMATASHPDEEQYAFVDLPKLSDQEWDSQNAYSGQEVDDMLESFNINSFGRLYFED